MVQVRFDLSGFSEDEVALARLVALMLDLRPFWPRLVPIFIGWMRRQFETEGEFLLGTKWAPLSPDYLAWKQANYPGKGILYLTGQLRRQASTPKRIVTPTSLTFSLPPFVRKDGKEMDPIWFMEGTERMPARPLWAEVLHAEARAQVDEAAQLYVDEMVARLGLKE